MTTFVLVPGAGLGADAYADVVARLADRGHAAEAVTLRGLGTRAHEADATTDLRDHVTDVVASVGDRDDIVLVGHSYAASVVWEAMPRLEGRVRRVVLLGAVPPSVGSSAFDELPPEGREQVTALVSAYGDGWLLPPFTRDLLDVIWGDHGFDDGSWARYEAVAGGHPFATLRTPVTVPLDAELAVARTHVVCLGDPYPAPDLPAPWERVSLDAGHWPMLTVPDRLVDLLESLAMAPAIDSTVGSHA